MNESTAWIDMVSEVAHDLKTPITSARGFIELLMKCGDPLSTRQTRYGTVALQALDQMEQLVARLLEVAWIDAERPLETQTCDLGLVIGRAAAALGGFAERHQVGIDVQIDPQLGSVQADARRIEQVMLNLLSNAVKYNHPEGQVWVLASGEAESVVVAVRDTGRGISADDAPHVFERFFRSNSEGYDKVEGTGLGLAIVKALIEKHGGRVWVESSLGEGSTFTFVLPRVLPLSEGYEANGEPIRMAVDGAESIETPLRVESSEQLDAVDDNLQEPPQAAVDRDETDVAEQE